MIEALTDIKNILTKVFTNYKPWSIVSTLLASNSKPTPLTDCVIQIEAGKRAVSAELLEKILRAADYRPSIPLSRCAPSISRYATEQGLESLRVFGSVAQGTDGFESDIDLIGTPTRELSLFELADIASFTSELTGFPTEVHADTHVPEDLRNIIDEAVPL